MGLPMRKSRGDSHVQEGISRLACAALLAGGLSCSGPTEPVHSDIDLARRAWLESHPDAYSERGELNSASFDRHGVPVKFDYGPWEVDGGVGYWVRNFTRIR